MHFFLFGSMSLSFLFCLGQPGVSGIRDTALDSVHPLLGTLSILGTEVIHTFAGLELRNQIKRTRDEGKGCSMALGKCESSPVNFALGTAPESLNFQFPSLPSRHFMSLAPKV